MLSRPNRSPEQIDKAAEAQRNTTELDAHPARKAPDKQTAAGEPTGEVATASESVQVSVTTADQGFASG